jgi:hypothetical protein
MQPPYTIGGDFTSMEEPAAGRTSSGMALLNLYNAPDPLVPGERQPARLDYDAIKSAALGVLSVLAPRWLPDGRREGVEWVAKNPRRADRHAGSFRVNMRTGCWADFATGDKGGDVISLAAYLDGCSQREAAERLAAGLGLEARP